MSEVAKLARTSESIALSTAIRVEKIPNTPTFLIRADVRLAIRDHFLPPRSSQNKRTSVGPRRQRPQAGSPVRTPTTSVGHLPARVHVEKALPAICSAVRSSTPIAQSRLLRVADGQVEFWTKDKKQKKRVTTIHPIREFVALLAEHILDRYRHAIRYFGLSSPCARRWTSAAVFALLGQNQRSRPRRLSWQASLKKYFGIDPLVDSYGLSMSWARRAKPVAS